MFHRRGEASRSSSAPETFKGGGELNRKEGGRKKKRQREATFEFSICGEGESEGQKSENPALTRDKAKETSASLLRNPC